MPTRKKPEASSKPKTRPGKEAPRQGKKTGARANPRDAAILTAFAADGRVVARRRRSIYEYYDGVTRMMDSDEYRKERGITRVTGKLYDDKGRLLQDWENEYRSSGALKRGRAVYEDGTVQEFVIDAKGRERRVGRKKRKPPDPQKSP